MPRLEMIKDVYADTGWRVDDIKERRPSWTHEQCDEFLKNIEKKIEEAVIATGWDVIDHELNKL